jgi:hypothetical protein
LGNVKVLYRSPKGVMSFERKKPIFQQKGSTTKLEIGLGLIVTDSFVDKGDFAFAEIINVQGVLPATYATIDNFENVGVPVTIHIGTYGNSLFIKEEYKDKTVIKALDEVGNILLSENKQVNYDAFNSYYFRLDNVITDWKDVTAEILEGIVGSIRCKEADLNIGNPYILYALKRLYRKKVLKASNGVIIAEGRHESLVIWGTSDKASMAWCGRILDSIGKTTDITEELGIKMLESGLI